MPYIQRERRPRIEKGIKDALPFIENPGDLNFAITKLCLGYIAAAKPSYQRFNSVIGVLSCAALELYRKQIAPYEDAALVRNGPIASEPGLCGHPERDYQHGRWTCATCHPGPS